MSLKRFLAAFFTFCGLLAAADFFVPHAGAHFPWEKWPLFYGVFGFVACVALVLAAKHLLRPLVRCEEDYYGD